MVLPRDLKDNSSIKKWKDPDAARSAKRVHVKRGTERTTQRYLTASINVGSISYEHAWYITKMEGIISVIVNAVDAVSRSLRFIVICTV